MFAHSLVLAASTLFAFSSVTARPTVQLHHLVERHADATAPAGWEKWGYEAYPGYHARYDALNCRAKHDTPFFESCCRPLRAGVSLSTKPAECDPSKAVAVTTSAVSTAAATTSSVVATTTTVPNNVVDEEDCTEEEDDDTEIDTTGDEYEEDCTEDDGEEDDGTDVNPATTTPAASATPTSTVKATSAPATTSKAQTTTKAQTTSKTSSAAPTSSAKTTSDSSNDEVFKGGYATFFTQNGNAGACGKVHGDGELIAAIDYRRWGKKDFGSGSPTCGKKARVTNPANGKTVDVVIADVCPTCENQNSLDLSTGAFNKIATPKEGMVKIEWTWLN